MSADERRPVIAVLSEADESPWPGLEALADEAELHHCVERDELAEVLPEAEVLVVTDFRTPLVRELWDRAERLRWMHATSAGVDAILFPESAESDVAITNARGVFDRPIAEYVLGLVTLFAKDFHGSLALKREHRWQHRDTEMLRDRKALVVGAGSIGREIAKCLRGGLDMHVEGVARSARDEDPDFAAVHANEKLHELLGEADFVILSVPLTKETEGMFGAEEFDHMRPDARLINIARGAVLCSDDLVAALREERIAGAALDVFHEEPLPANHPLWDMPQVFISAHMAGDVVGWRERLSEQFVDNFRRWRRGEDLRNLVDKSRGYVTSRKESDQ